MNLKITKTHLRNIFNSTLTLVLLLCCQVGSSQTNNNSYIFGHSLVNHSANQATQNRSNIPDWMYLLAQQAGNDYSVDGQFGFLPLQQLPPTFQWGFINAPNTRTNEANEDFGSWDYNNVIITLANFIQQTSTPSQNAFCDQQYIEDCNLDPNALSSVEAVVRILDYARTEESGIDFYIYENWPEFNGTFPTVSEEQEAQEFGAYYGYTKGEFHDWWITLQDEVLAARPDSNAKLIPVGPILADLLSDAGILSDIPSNVLYEDGAPHGYPVIYFLTALIHYSVIYGEQPPANFQFPDADLAAPIRIPDTVKNNYTAIVDFIWNSLQTYLFNNGESRVFLPSQVLSVNDITVNIPKPILYPNPGNGIFNLELPNSTIFPVELKVINTIGQVIDVVSITDHQSTKFNLDKKGTFFLKIIGDQYSDIVKLIVK
ncbi:T9SS type A sorting domain-containing protein [uncultured Aquimarina sp.]|uniref:T9SS type A sorting domain-containing protein n=1 Tax=uncultured Aquimarina sp. TaxID=575652 RepID=UPI002604B1E7|nr:T9SS type A sorting domain-containing protein [uncultured Aquimarina sp.]